MWLYKNRTHAADILGGTWPTTVERRTTADSVFNLVSTSILWQILGKTVSGLKMVFVGGEYWEIKVSGLKMFFVGGEYWDITVSGLKMGNNSQWAENGFLLEAENGYKRERATAIAHKMSTQT